MKICPDCKRSYPTSFAVCPQDGARLSESLEWVEGTLIRGKYRIVAKIGEGGMGAVYKATHLHFNESCALKVMSPNLANDSALVKRFGREAIIARKLRHKNAVKVEDFDETEDGRPFIVMEYIEGQSLKSLMSKVGPLPVLRSSSIIKQAAAALDAAHQLGLIHRDIKPDNIVLVVSNGEEIAKVLDFGIAKIRDSGGGNTVGMGLTATGMVIGTPPYMSPEQARGADSEAIDGRSDIYSLGVVMYQMLTGLLPLKADTPLDMLFAQMQTPPIPIHEARPGLRISAPIGAIVMRCLEKDPARRPQTGRELIEEMERCEKTQPVSEHSSSFKDFSESTTVAETPARFPVTAPMPNSTMPSATMLGGEQTLGTVLDRNAGQVSEQAEVHSAANCACESSPTPAPTPIAGSASSPNPVGAASSSSSVKIIATLVVLVLVLTGGGWYYSQRNSAERQKNPAQDPSASPTAKSPSSAQPTSTQSSAPSSDPSAAPVSGKADGAAQPAANSAQPKSSVPKSSPPISAEEKATRAKKVTSVISLGDLYFDNGEFDNAIKEYQLGLDLDPANKSLHEKMDRARKAKDSPKQ